MHTDAQNLFDQALKLPADAREILAAQLMGSVEPSEAEASRIKAAWVEEIDRREAKLESEQSIPISIEEAWPQLTGMPWTGNTDGND